MFPTDAKLMNRAREIMVRLANGTGSSFAKATPGRKLALIKHQRYAHATSSSAPTALRKLRTDPARVIRDVGRRIEARRLAGGLRQAHEPASGATTTATSAARRSNPCMPRGGVHRQGQSAPALRVRRQGQRRDHPQAFKRRPVRRPVAACPAILDDGHATLGTVIPAMEQMIGNTIERASPMPDIEATMRRPVTASRSTPPARSVALHRRSNASSSAVLRSSP